MAKGLDWDKAKKLRREPERPEWARLSTQQIVERDLATDKQKALLLRLNATFPANITKREASSLISHILD